jgi:hypothetical protein
MVSVSTVRKSLVEFFAEQARWRRGKASEYPDDQRNEVSASRLEDLARYVAGLPDDNLALHRLVALATEECPELFEVDGLFLPPAGDEGLESQCARRVSRLGFDRDEEPNPAAFFESWVGDVVEEARKQAASMTEMEASKREPD